MLSDWSQVKFEKPFKFYSGQSNDITDNVCWRQFAGSDKAMTGSGEMQQEPHNGNAVMIKYYDAGGNSPVRETKEQDESQ